FKVVQNPSKRATAPCWQSFGFPAREENNQKFEVIRGYASCKNCFETYRYIDSSTANLNNHQCPRVLSSNQPTIKSHIQSPRSPAARKQVSTKKEKMKYLCARWVADSMRPFQIVSGRGFKQLVQECINIGRDSRSDSFILADDILSCERTMKNEIDRLAEQERVLALRC
ncbi:unnamed protein product, partial [Didymodactylos carnosus]